MSLSFAGSRTSQTDCLKWFVALADSSKETPDVPSWAVVNPKLLFGFPSLAL